MSNNNPHGHLNQPADNNPSWNPLQIPSFIPRQPQLAHISNERSMVRSPLAWHAPPPPPDSIYNFMSSNPKNLDPQMNPLLPPSFVRGPLPFDSMDLSLQSSRNAITPLTKSGMPPASQLDFGHPQKLAHQQQQQHQSQQPHNAAHQSHHQQQQNQQQQQHQQHQQQTQQQLLSQHLQQTHNTNYSALHNLSASHNSSLIHAQQQQLQHLHQQQNNMPLSHSSQLAHSSLLCGPNPNLSPPSSSSNNPKYLGTNGNECESMLPPASPAHGSNTGSSSSGNNGNNVNSSSPLQYIRDSESNYGKPSLLKRGYDPNEVLAMHKPVDLNNKDINYASIMTNKLQNQQQTQNSSKKPSPLRNYSSNVGHHAAQMQQHHLSYNNAIPNKRNGPHTPPTPQSPIHQGYNMPSPSPMPSHSSMHQSPTLSALHSGNGPNMMDYSSLHLQQQSQQNSSFPLPHNQQQHQQQHQQYLEYQMQQSQHLQTQQQQVLHHHMMQQHQQQQHQQQQQNLHMGQSPSRQANHQNQQSPLQQKPAQQQHCIPTQQQHLPHPSKQLTPSQTPQQSPMATPQRTPLSSPLQQNYPKSAEDLKKSELAGSPYAYNDSMARKKVLHEDPESPETMGSVEDSQESINNTSAKVLKRKVKNFTNSRSSSNEDNEENNEHHMIKKSYHQITSNDKLINASSTPKSSPSSQSRKSPRNNSFVTPLKDHSSLEKDSVIPSPASPLLNKQDISDINQKNLQNENGRSPSRVFNNTQKELETIEKIASSLTKGLNNDVNSNSNYLIKSIYDNDSPKTKKQRQALKLRNAELMQTNSNGSNLSSTFNENSNHSNDNAVQDVPKMIGNEAPIAFLPPLKPATENILGKRLCPAQERSVSPHSNSQSSDSSSSSSSSSQSSHSSSFSSPIKLVNKCTIPPLQHQDQSKGLKVSSKINENEQQNGVVEKSIHHIKEEKDEEEINLSKKVVSPSNASAKPIEEVENKLQEMFSDLEENSAQLLPGEEEIISQTPPIPSPELVKDLTSALQLTPENSKPTSPVHKIEHINNIPTDDSLKKTLEQDDSDEEKTNDIINLKTANENDLQNIQKKHSLLPKTNSCNEIKASIEAIAEEDEDEKPLSLKISETKEQKPDKLKLPDNLETTLQIKESKEEKVDKKPLEIIKDIPTKNVDLSQTHLTESKENIPTPRPVTTKAAKKTISDIPMTSLCLGKASTVDIPPEITTQRFSPRRRLAVNYDVSMPDNLQQKPIKEEEKDVDLKSSVVSTDDSSKKVHIHIDDEKPSTSKAAVAALVARTKAEKKAAAAAAAAAKRTTANTTKSKGKNTKGRGSVPASKKNQKGKKKNGKGAQYKNQQMRRKPNGGGGGSSSSEEEHSTTHSRETTTTAEKYKSPYILVKKDGSVTVVNAPSSEDTNEKQLKKPSSGYSHDRKKIRGLHSSTLGKKYDADTTDPSWICVFCKRGPHKLGLGDLFGPYEVSINCNEYKLVIDSPDAIDSDEEFISKRRRKDMIQKDPRCPPVVPATVEEDKKVATNQKRTKLEGDEEDTDEELANGRRILRQPLYLSDSISFIGMTKNSETTYEIWVHEDCAVWAPNVFLVGNRITGLQAAVWNSLRHYCNVCGNNGAMVCCLNRSCKAPAHISCAQSSQWYFDETKWQVYCDKHIPEHLSNVIVKNENISINNIGS